MHRLLWETKTREQLLAASHEDPAGHDSGQGGGALARSLRTSDLLAIGVGSTVGTGVFSITGQVARMQAGPAVVLCWMVGGLGCSLSAISYIELSARLPVTGSVYAFAYHVLGEVFAVVGASCITLEYGISASAVAANWGDKFRALVQALGAPQLAAGLSIDLGPVTLSAPALLLLLLVTGLIGAGGALGKAFTRGSSMLAVLLILGMSAVALVHFDGSHFAPLVPPEQGLSGVLAGSVTTFFGFLGYDEVCCLAGEAQDPQRSIPRSVLGTILLATLLPVVGSLGLVGLVPYKEIDQSSGFEAAFRLRGWTALSHAVSIGELVVLFVVTYMCFMAQPRVFFALAKDGLLPAAFLDLDSRGGLRFATYATGALLVLCGALLPFGVLANAISGGVLVAFNLVNSCLVLLRHRGPGGSGGTGARPIGGTLAAYVVLSALAAILFAGAGTSWAAVAGAAALAAAALVSLGLVASRLRRGGAGVAVVSGDGPGAGGFFQVPCVPWVPALAILFNNIMLASLEARDFVLLTCYLLAVLAVYLCAVWRRHRRQAAGAAALPVLSLMGAG